VSRVCIEISREGMPLGIYVWAKFVAILSVTNGSIPPIASFPRKVSPGNVAFICSRHVQIFSSHCSVKFVFCMSIRHKNETVFITDESTLSKYPQINATLCRFYIVPLMVMWWPTCNYNTCTRGRRASFFILLMMGAWRPKHVEWLCRNKTWTVLHQVGVLFDLYYGVRKH